ncbi:MAG TPA: hypothetical protein DCS43_03690, partial [Verrucomicrobia bacterium]|nr:hypothetical protein [Verrucomicrobiota bacterium]
MTMPDSLKGLNRAETESWILKALESEKPLPLDDLMAVLEHFGSAGIDRRVDGWSELLQDALMQRQDGRGVLRVLALRCVWHAHEPAFKAICAKAVELSFTTRLGKVLFKHAGFDHGGVGASEAVRRMTLLSKLEKGVFCADKTWGFGIVQRVDDFYAKVAVDFDRKRGHEMALAYAAEVLDLVPESHLLVRLHRDAAGVKSMISAKPGELVRLVLMSYGPANMDAIKGYLCGTVMEEKAWKGFWDAARKALKSDPLVHVPAKKTDPLRLLESADDHIREQFALLDALRDPETILKQVDAFEAAGLLAALTPEFRKVVADRLAFAVWGAEDRTPILAARALLTSERLGVVDAGLLGDRRIDMQQAYNRLLEGTSLQDVLQGVPARLMPLLLERFMVLFPVACVERVLALMPVLSVPVLQESLTLLRKGDCVNRVDEALRGLLQTRKASPSVLFCLLRNGQEFASVIGDDISEILHQGLDTLEWPASGEMLKAQHQLRALYESGEWLGDRLDSLNPEQREVFIAKLQSSQGWDETGRRSVIAGIIKRFPELQKIISGKPDATAPKARARMTSWRSYRERQETFRKLMEIEIPDNAKEIAVARSYGDLRENAEFKYAKEHQRILYRR